MPRKGITVTATVPEDVGLWLAEKRAGGFVVSRIISSALQKRMAEERKKEEKEGGR